MTFTEPASTPVPTPVPTPTPTPRPPSGYRVSSWSLSATSGVDLDDDGDVDNDFIPVYEASITVIANAVFSESYEVLSAQGMPIEQARLIAGTVGGIRIVGLYAPNGQSLSSPAYQYKLQWYAKLTRWLKTQTTPVLVCGDFNVAPEDIDTWDAKLWEGQTLASAPERAAFAELKQQNALVDLFRVKHPEPERFTWWDYRAGAFHKNQGLRIDHILVSEALVARCTEVEVDREARKGKLPSDHAPVWAEFA